MEYWRKNYYDIPQVCIRCGKVLDGEEKGTIDHYIPFCVAGSEAERNSNKDHPFLTVVRHPDNLFRICSEEEHDSLDSQKVAAFLDLLPDDDVFTYLAKVGKPGTERGEPKALIKFLMTSYPITENLKFRRLQLRKMVTVNNLFRRIAYQLDGQLHPDLEEKYRHAAVLIGPFNRYLHSVRSLRVPSSSLT